MTRPYAIKGSISNDQHFELYLEVIFMFIIIAARILYAFYWKRFLISVQEWLINLWEYALMSGITAYLKSKSGVQFSLIWRPFLNYVHIIF